MTMPTKAQIDAIFDSLEQQQGTYRGIGPERDIYIQRRDAYQAAGLNVDGSEKRKVRDALLRVYNEMVGDDTIPGTWDGTTFTPDGGK